MRTVIQRVSQASVKVDNKIVGQIGPGLLVLLGVGEGDIKKPASRDSFGMQKSNIKYLVDKVVNLRIFEGKKSHFDKSLLDVGGEILVVPQFTLYADTSQGRRPFFGEAAKPEIAKKLFEKFIAILKEKGVRVEKGVFGAKMEVELINDGPVTIILDSDGQN